MSRTVSRVFAGLTGLLIVLVPAAQVSHAAGLSAGADHGKGSGSGGVLSDRAGHLSSQEAPRSAATTVVAPSFPCPLAVGERTLYLGIDAGDAMYSRLELTCGHGKASLRAATQAGGEIALVNVAVGDRLRLSVFETDTAEGPVVTTAIDNITSGETISSTSAPEVRLDPVFFGATPRYAGERIVRIMDFGQVQFSRTQVDGENVSRTSTTEYDRFIDGDFDIDATRIKPAGEFRLDFVSFLR